MCGSGYLDVVLRYNASILESHVWLMLLLAVMISRESNSYSSRRIESIDYFILYSVGHA